MGGVTTPSITNTMDFVTIATTSNAVDFGDLSVDKKVQQHQLHQIQLVVCLWKWNNDAI